MRQVGLSEDTQSLLHLQPTIEGPNKKLTLDSMIGFPQFIRLYFHTQARRNSRP